MDPKAASPGGARVLTTCPLPQRAIDRLRAVATHIEDVSNHSAEQLVAAIAEADAVLTFPWSMKIDAAMIAAAKRLRVVATVAVGYDNVDVAACAARGIKVGNTPGVVVNATADIGMALILSTMRRIASGVDFVRAGRWDRGESLPYGNDLANKTLGIFGMGDVGTALAKRARASEMRITYYNRRPRSDAPDAEYVSFDRLLAESDVIAVTAPLTPETRGAFGAEAFAKMKPGAYFINVARGGLVQTDALYEALRSGHLAFAGLDVTDPEPLPRTHPLWTLQNVVIVPHIGTATSETRDAMVDFAVSNVVAGLRGEPLPGEVRLPGA